MEKVQIPTGAAAGLSVIMRQLQKLIEIAENFLVTT
jgi:hypothetical protein